MPNFVSFVASIADIAHGEKSRINTHSIFHLIIMSNSNLELIPIKKYRE